MNSRQQAFLQHIGTLIPKLFDAIRMGNVKSECVLGDRIIGQRQVRLKLVVEVVDPGSNPLATHSQMRRNQVQAMENATQPNQPEQTSQPSQLSQVSSTDRPNPAKQPTISNQTKPTTPRRGPRRNHPLSR